VRAPLPANEAERLNALQRYGVLDTPEEPEFDRITQLAARLFEVPMAFVSLIDANRQWWKSCVGVSGRETHRDVAFCAHAILSSELFVVGDALGDPRFSDNPLVTGPPFIRFYAGAPLLNSEGYSLGTLCILDARPRELTQADRDTLTDLSRVVVDALELRRAYRSRALFQKVCEMSPSLIYLYDRVKRERTFLGRHLAQELGYDKRQVGADLWREIVDPEDLPRLYQHIEQLDALEQGPIELSYRIRDTRGQSRWFLSREAIFERDAEGRVKVVIGITTEITDLKTTELRLERSEDLLAERVQLLEGILESAGEGIVVADENASFTVFNPAARRIIGDGPIIGSRAQWPRAYCFLRPSDGQLYPTEDLPLARALRGEPSDDTELLVRRSEVPDRRIRVAGRPLRHADGKIRGGILTFNDITALRAAESELAKLAVTDQLTALPNRRAFDERLALLVAEGGRGRQFALVLGDIDHFKKVNDTLGHSVGDEVLAHVAQTLQKRVRCTDFVGRYGGEEFCVLFTDVDANQAVRLADGLRAAVADGRCRVPLTVSFGVCTNRPGERTDPGTLIEAADRALYAAKSQGRNRVVLGDLSHRQSIPSRSGIKARA
jgi:diguanylate cyclase (GGDEF)-like protein/PAS domain S-box-containing protein